MSDAEINVILTKLEQAYQKIERLEAALRMVNDEAFTHKGDGWFLPSKALLEVRAALAKETGE